MVPTIKIFFPHSDREFEGLEIPYKNNTEHFLKIILENLSSIEVKSGKSLVSLQPLR